MTSKKFHLGQLLSITGDRMVSPNYLDGIYEVIEFVTGQRHATHQLPRAADEVKPWLLKQHPWLGDVVVPDGLDSEEKVLMWLVKATAQYGSMHPVEPMPLGMYVGREPMAELQEMVGDRKIIQVDLGDED